jgi:hypothetical protein
VGEDGGVFTHGGASRTLLGDRSGGEQHAQQQSERYTPGHGMSADPVVVRRRRSADVSHFAAAFRSSYSRRSPRTRQRSPKGSPNRVMPLHGTAPRPGVTGHHVQFQTRRFRVRVHVWNRVLHEPSFSALRPRLFAPQPDSDHTLVWPGSRAAGAALQPHFRAASRFTTFAIAPVVHQSAIIDEHRSGGCLPVECRPGWRSHPSRSSQQGSASLAPPLCRVRADSNTECHNLALTTGWGHAQARSAFRA